MNFTAALAETDTKQRDCLIAAEIQSHDWLDDIANRMTHGGWPEQAAARVIKIETNERAVRVFVVIDFTELCPQGCNAYPRRFVETVEAEIEIHRQGANHQVRVG
jgi:hypothetical protein